MGDGPPPWTSQGTAEAAFRQQGHAAFAASHLRYLTSLDVTSEPLVERLTGVICTLGPASAKPEVLDELLAAGMSVARLNFSHGSYDYHGETIRLVREAVERFRYVVGTEWSVAIALDTRGPEIRTGMLQGGGSAEITLAEGQVIRLTTDANYAEVGTAERLYVDYENMPNVVKEGDLVFMDDGLIALKVKEVVAPEIVCEVENGGKLGSRKGINLPGVPVDLPGVSEKDTNDLRWGVEQGIDMVFASFIRDANTVRDVRSVLGADGKRIMIISKIENQQGINNIDEIIEESDGIMIARGDMGIEIPLQKVPLAQKNIIAKCNLAGKPVVCATQMLESMTNMPRATRAESTDVANAVLDGADCVMLSGESAKGKFPVECVKLMSSLCKEAEAAVWSRQVYSELSFGVTPPLENDHATALGAVRMALQCRAACIVVLTTTGRSAKLLSRYRPRCPIVAVTRDPMVGRQLKVFRAVVPLLYVTEPLDEWEKDVDLRFQFAIAIAKSRQFVRYRDAMVLVNGWRPGPGHNTVIRLVYASATGTQDQAADDQAGQCKPAAVGADGGAGGPGEDGGAGEGGDTGEGDDAGGDGGGDAGGEEGGGGEDEAAAAADGDIPQLEVELTVVNPDDAEPEAEEESEPEA